MENELQFETPYESFVYAIRSPVTREKYLGRIANFISFAGIIEGNIEQRCNIFGEKLRGVESKRAHLDKVPSGFVNVINEFTNSIFN